MEQAITTVKEWTDKCVNEDFSGWLIGEEFTNFTNFSQSEGRIERFWSNVTPKLTTVLEEFIEPLVIWIGESSVIPYLHGVKAAVFLEEKISKSQGAAFAAKEYQKKKSQVKTMKNSTNLYIWDNNERWWPLLE